VSNEVIHLGIDKVGRSWEAAEAMQELGLFLLVAALAGISAFVIQRVFFGGGLFTGGAVRIPKRFVVNDVPTTEIPPDARRPLDYLTEKLRRLGFAPADLPVRVPALQSIGHQVLLVPFAHPEESAIFLMGIESRLPRTELMLHIVTPLKNGRRVETSTLGALRHLRPPDAVDVRVVTDAESIDEIWSHHRRALMAYERAERQEIDPEGWKVPIAQAYDAWVQAAIRSRRIQLSRDGHTYQLRRGE
jgi:hypothetical protein